MSDSHPFEEMDGLLSDLGEIPDPSTAKPQLMRRSSNPLHHQQQQRQQRQQNQSRQSQQPHQQQQRQQRQRQRQQQQQQQQQHLPAASRLETDAFQVTPSSQNPKAVPQQRAPKVAIPRLQRGPEIAPSVGSPLAEEKARVNHACEPCRHRKTKCSGDRPSCKHCEDFKIACFYADRKREKSRKEFGAMAKRLEEYERLFRDLILRVDEKDQRLIRKALEHEFASEDDETLSQSSSRTTTAFTSKIPGAAGKGKGSQADRANDERVDDEVSSEDGDGRPSLARVGSTRSLGHVNEDFNSTAATRATGFMGKNSELSWMQRLKKEADVQLGLGEVDMPMLNVASSQENLQHPISESTYHCDDLSMLVLDHVDPYQVPSRQTADRLFEYYLDTVHPTFPIIGKTTFLDQYRTYQNTNLQAGANWLAILNLMFAIGAKYSRLIRADWGGKEGDDLIYFTRARLLGFNTDSILDHAGLQSVQVAGLIAFYLSAIDQISRAWTFSGIAMRHALSLGLNLQNNSDSISNSSKEIRRRVWWAVCSVDIRLAVMTGRPSAFLSATSTVPLPLPVEEESFFPPGISAFPSGEEPLHPRYPGQESPYIDDASSNPPSSSSAEVNPSPTEFLGPKFSQTPAPASNALYFLLQTKLSLITNEVLDQLYRPSVVTRSWDHVQLIISALTEKLERWRTGLPSIFDFSRWQRDLRFRRHRMCLGLFYYSTAMIISRPCLCRMNRTMRPNSEKSKEFERATAAKCVHAAKDMLDLFPTEPEPAVLYQVAPWWCLVHHLVQASTISMLELSFQADHVPEEVENILQTATQAARWLRSMAEMDLAASRAWRLCEDMLHKVASMVGKPLDSFSDGTSFDGGDGGEHLSPDHSYYTPLTGPDGAANMRERSTLMHPSEEPDQQRPFGGERPFHAQIYTPYDEIFPPSFRAPVVMAVAESPSDFLSMYPSPGQMEGLLSGDLDEFSMTRDD